MAKPEVAPLYLRIQRMRCNRLAYETKKIVEKIFNDYKVGIKKLGVILQYCNTKAIRSVPPLLLQEYRSFKISMERSVEFSEKALAASAQVTVIEHRLFEKLNIPLEFEFE